VVREVEHHPYGAVDYRSWFGPQSAAQLEQARVAEEVVFSPGLRDPIGVQRHGLIDDQVFGGAELDIVQ